MIIDYGDTIFLPLGIYFKNSSALVIADTHIGFERALQKQGIQMPRSYYPDIKRLVEEYINIIRPEVLVLAGDVKEDFGEFNFQEFFELKDFLTFLKDFNLKVEVVRGNHDNYLLPFLKRFGIEGHEEFLVLDDLFITHGHLSLEREIKESKAKKIVFGHEHPSVAIIDQVGASLKFKATVTGEVHGKEMFIVPPFSPLKPGNDINTIQKYQLLSPIFRASDLSKCKVHIYEEDEWFSFDLKDIS